MNVYLDSSALAKLYVQEKGTEFVRTLFISDEQNLLFSAKITRIEVASAILNLAFSLTKRRPLKGYDAIQLASALHLNAQILAEGDIAVVFSCADDSLCSAAISEGLQTINPNAYG